MVNKKLCIITSVHPVLDTRIFYRECKSLFSAGYEVVFVAPHNQDQIIDGITIRAVPIPKNRFSRMTLTVWQVFCKALKENCSIYHFHDPELLIIGIFLKILGKKVIYDVHEDVPQDIMTKYWIPKSLRIFISWIINVIEKSAVYFVDFVIAATPSIAKRFSTQKTIMVQNFPNKQELSFDNTQLEFNKRKNLIVYIGDLTAIRGLREIVDAMALLPTSLETEFIIAGTFSQTGFQEELQSTSGWKYVNYLGWQSRDNIKELLSQVKVGMVTFHPAPNHIEAQPNKLFEYMSAGIPVIASDFPLWRKIVHEVDCGLLVDPEDPTAIAKAIQWFLEHPAEAEAMGKRGQEAVYSKYNWQIESEKLLNLYGRLFN